MKPMKLLSKEDQENIASYRNYILQNYGINNSSSLKNFLKPWDKAKSSYLQNIFKDSLIISEPYYYKKNSQEIISEIENEIKVNRICQAFIKNIEKKYKKTPDFKFIKLILQPINLYYNIVPIEYDIQLNNKIFKIHKGMKIMRILKKISDDKGLSELYEEFRSWHSLILNNKIEQGELCLSIHPLDFLTLSDNNSGWTTCYSLKRQGLYSQGVLELMNSPNIVVGYLASKKNKYSWAPNHEWNTKKWRTLFIVDSKFIINIKNYPYQSLNLTKLLMNKIITKSNWENFEISDLNYLKKQYYPNFEITTVSGFNDFTLKNIFHLTAIKKENNISKKKRTHILCNYSGVGQCLCCGKINDMNSKTPIIEYSNELFCKNCLEGWSCKVCKTHYPPEAEKRITEEGAYICPSCLDYCVHEALENKLYLKNNCFKLILSKSNTGYIKGEKNIIIYIGDMGQKLWNECFLIKKFHSILNPDNFSRHDFYVKPNECTEKGLRLFNINSQEELKIYQKGEK